MAADTAGSSWTHTGLAQQLHFAPRAIERAGEVVRGLRARRVLLMTTEGRLASPAGEALQAALGRVLVTTFAGVRSHVPAAMVEEAVARARDEQVDLVVSFGGGSCADAAKAVCFFMERRAGTPGSSYLDRPVLGHVAIPTTYSGAELTPFFGMTDEAARRKQGSGGPTLAPLAAIYDPLVTLDLPARVTAETGMNCLAHGVECAYSPERSPEAEALALACVGQVSTALPRLMAEEGDLEVRSLMLTGAALGGRCLQNARMGVHHGLSQLVGGRTGIPHGLANAILLTHAMAFNQETVPEEMARIGEALGDPADPAGAVDRLREGLSLPGRLADLGVTEEDLDVVARESQASPTVAGNPRPVTEADAREILAAAW